MGKFLLRVLSVLFSSNDSKEIAEVLAGMQQEPLGLQILCCVTLRSSWQHLLCLAQDNSEVVQNSYESFLKLCILFPFRINHCNCISGDSVCISKLKMTFGGFLLWGMFAILCVLKLKIMKVLFFQFLLLGFPNFKHNICQSTLSFLNAKK